MNDLNNIFICGFSGAGKSTLLKKLAIYGRGKEYLFLDLDEALILSSPYKTLKEWWEKKGEGHFRQKEGELLLEWIAQPTKKVIALGGGTLDHPQNMQNILESRGIVIYLKVSFELCQQRIKDDSQRPLVKRGKTFLEKLYQKRNPLYQQAASLILTPEKVSNLREWSDFEEFLKDC